ncbi:polysaccharide pyruvyl transferase family protein [uncultured Bacteroides sp.]|jgi:Polysaccharide pyruvyl transferase.|uniref:polysaccharide pyruvyl transferase family protein n=1 Tax=uncultured Bacteroides sp. TaxID=162156 RepID=UPI002674F591|nr:polysaccharide pyruvyl transferase family protein [uncultured Bacteroides sp.]
MKIAILTLPLHANYGGILQCYALCSVLEKMGHEVKVINHRCMRCRPLFRILLSILKFAVLNPNQKLDCEELKNYRKAKAVERRIVGFQETYKKYLPLTSRTYEVTRFSKLLLQGFDAFIVGSDQVWRPLYANDLKNYYLEFLGDSTVKRISYAASFGVDYAEYSSEQIRACGSLLERFDAVSVRESSGIGLISSIYRWRCKPPQTVLDPTLLLCEKDYMEKFCLGRKKEEQTGKKKETHEEKELPFLCKYILDKSPEAETIVKWLSADNKLPVNELTSPDIIFRTDIFSCDDLCSPAEWLDNIRNSGLVVTDSFHGCVFSILFHKRFIVFSNSSRGSSRLECLLKMVGLEERLLKSVDDFFRRKERLVVDIDYKTVDKTLLEEREKSMKYLFDALLS